MPRERKGTKKAASLEDGPDGPVKPKKARRGSNAANAQMRAGSAGPGPGGPNDQMLIPPQPISSYGDTLYAANPFDDTPHCGPLPPHGMPPMPPGGPPMMNHGPPHPGMMGPGNGMMGPGGMMGPRPSGPPPPGMKGGPLPPGMMPPGMCGPHGPGMPPGGPPGMPPLPPSGRIYPPEQSMVFNSANPNAPPIYPCGTCHKEVHENDQGLMCESGCNFWYHRSCVGLSERGFSLLVQEAYAEWVCDLCRQNKNIPPVKYKS